MSRPQRAAMGKCIALRSSTQMLKYWLILTVSIGAVVYAVIAAFFFGWIAQTSNDKAMADQARSHANFWSFIIVIAFVGFTASVVRLIQLHKSRKNTKHIR